MNEPDDQRRLPGPYDEVEEVQPRDDGRVARLADEEPAGAEPTERDAPAAAPELPETGDRVVDDALERLVAVQDDPPADQVETYVGAHRALQNRLADLEG